MCARYSVTKTDMRQLELRFGATPPEPLAPTYNAKPTHALPVILHEDPRRIQLLRWGLIPPCATDSELRYATFNARVEDASGKPAYRNAWRTFRQ